MPINVAPGMWRLDDQFVIVRSLDIPVGGAVVGYELGERFGPFETQALAANFERETKRQCRWAILTADERHSPDSFEIGLRKLRGDA